MLTEYYFAAGKIMAKYKVGKFFLWKIDGSKLTWGIDEQKVQFEQALDGCCIIHTDVEESTLNKGLSPGLTSQKARNKLVLDCGRNFPQ